MPEKLTTYTKLAIVLLFFASGCTLNRAEEGGRITKGDLQAASQILGESLSSDNSGILLSLNDALTNISSTGFIPSSGSKSAGTPPVMQSGHSGRGDELNYHYSFNPGTGVHTISFERRVKRSLFEKKVTDRLHYIFRDREGNFVEFPRRESDRIASVTYNGRREGEISTLKKESFFVRRDTFLIDGLSGSSSTLAIDGVHHGKGTIEIERPDKNTLERSYDLEINFLNIKIEQPKTNTLSIQKGITGTLSWQMVIERNTGAGGASETLRGTIELSRDGTALLNFENFLKLFQVNMDNGDVKDLDQEFEGGVQSVRPEEQQVVLVNGQTLHLNSDTEFDSNDYPSLETVQQSLNNGIALWTEGEGSMQNGNFHVSEIEFEKQEEDEGGEGDEEVKFEEQVTSVDITDSTFTLNNRVMVKVRDNTIIENSSEYQSLQEVSDALDQGITVMADGDARRADEKQEADLIAISVDFDREDDSGEED